MTRRLPPEAFELAQRILTILDACIRRAGLQDGLEPLEKAQRARVSTAPLLIRGDYATRPGRGVSKLCLALVFGTGSPNAMWTALRKGSKVKSRFPRAIRLLARALNDAENARVEWSTDFSQALRHLGLGDFLDLAESLFFELCSHSDISRLRSALFAELQSDPKIALDEFDVDHLDKIEFENERVPSISLSDVYESSGYQITQYEHGQGLWSPMMSELLAEFGREWRPMIAYINTPFQAPDRSLGWKKLLDAQRQGQTAFNADKMGLRGDLLLDGVKLPNEIFLQACDYIDNLATNDIALQTASVNSRVDDGSVRTDTIVEGISLYCDENSQFLGYRYSKCSNQLGMSTLAITDDGVPLLVKQLQKNVQSSNRIAPSGSGSLDYPSDFEALNKGSGFGEWLLSVSLRELREELGIFPVKGAPASKRAWMDSLRVSNLCVGFGGLMHRAGKPDFFFLTRLHCRLHDIVENSHYSNVEKDLSARLADIKDLSLDSLDANCLRVLCENQQVAYRKKNSVPLAIIYDMLKHLCLKKEALITQFLSQNAA